MITQLHISKNKRYHHKHNFATYYIKIITHDTNDISQIVKKNFQPSPTAAINSEPLRIFAKQEPKKYAKTHPKTHTHTSEHPCDNLANLGSAI